MYTYQSRVRYSEIDKNGKLSLCSLLNYFQDCSTFHSEDIGCGYKYLLDRKLVWVLSAWQIVVSRYPALCENITVGTAPYEFRSVIGFRNFLMTGDTGEQLACANSVWTLLDLAKGRPVKPPPEMVNAYTLAEKLPMDYAERKIAVPGAGLTPAGGARPLSPVNPVEVKPRHLDTNNHVNNGQYVSLAMEILSDLAREGKDQNKIGQIRQLRAEYRKPAVLGDTLYPLILAFDNKEIVSLRDEKGAPFCIIEFLKEETSC